MTIAFTADFKTPPYLHQLREFETHAEDKSRALLWQMRTGKSKVIVDTACHLYKQDEIDAVLVIAPNGVHENWATREVPIHHWDTVDYARFVWRTAEIKKDPKGFLAGFKTAAKDKSKLIWFFFPSSIIARDDAKKYVKTAAEARKTLVVFDESHDYRDHKSKRTFVARALQHRTAYRRILTGTPIDNSPLHAFAQYELLERAALGFTKYSDFKEHYATFELKTLRTGRQYWAVGDYRNMDEMRDKMAALSSVVLREDCEDLPDLIRSRRNFDLLPEQRDIYKTLQEQFMFELDDEEVTVNEAAVKILKLQQVLSGFVIDENKKKRELMPPEMNPRLQVLLDEVRMSSGRVIIWCHYHHDIDLVAKALRAEGREVVEYHGRVSAAEKAKAREVMGPNTGDEGPDLVGQPMSGGQGLDFSVASRIIWYSHTFDAIVRGQADERATKVGGGNVHVVDIAGPGVDKYILDVVLYGKFTLADEVSKKGLKRVLEGMKI